MHSCVIYQQHLGLGLWALIRVHNNTLKNGFILIYIWKNKKMMEFFGSEPLSLNGIYNLIQIFFSSFIPNHLWNQHKLGYFKTNPSCLCPHFPGVPSQFVEGAYFFFEDSHIFTPFNLCDIPPSLTSKGHKLMIIYLMQFFIKYTWKL